jgi:hypothetical protein
VRTDQTKNVVIVARGNIALSAPFTGLVPRSGLRPALEGGWPMRTTRREARLRAFSQSGFSRAGGLKPYNEKPR